MQIIIKNLNNLKERNEIVKKELIRISKYVSDNNLFVDHNYNFLMKKIKKKAIDKIEIDNKNHALFFKCYIFMLGQYYGNLLRNLNDKTIKLELLTSYELLKDVNNCKFYDEIPVEMKDIIGSQYSESELEDLFDYMFRLIKTDGKEKTLLTDIVGEQISCINRSLMLDLELEDKSCCADSLFFIIEETIKLMDFTSTRTVIEMRADIIDFSLAYEKSKKEHNNVMRKKKINVPKLINGYYNFNELVFRLKKDE